METDWGAVVKESINTLGKNYSTLFTGMAYKRTLVFDNLSQPSSTIVDSGDAVIQLLMSATRRDGHVRASKILTNIEVAAFHLAYLLKVEPSFYRISQADDWQGNLDLPDSFEEFYGRLKEYVLPYEAVPHSDIVTASMGGPH